jgi:hypothetical protein
MKGHVFVVSQNTYPVHRDRGFAGIGHSQKQFNTYDAFRSDMLDHPVSGSRKMLVDMLGTRIGDLVLLYENNVGFHGIYQITGDPYFDNTTVRGINESRERVVKPNICLRVPIECKNYFPEPVPEDMLFATPERETLFWVWFYRKIQIPGGRGCTAINPDALETLVELLVRVNGKADTPPPTEGYAPGPTTQLRVPLGDEDSRPYEDILRGWFVRNIDNDERSDIQEVFGPASDLEWFANNVPYHVAGRHIDILAFHSSQRYSSQPIRYRYSVVELKRNEAKADHVEQLIGYSKWVASRLAGGEPEMVQPILVASRFREEAVTRAHHSDWSIRLVRYVTADGDVTLQPAGETA